jgi:hypothetical protein
MYRSKAKSSDTNEPVNFEFNFDDSHASKKRSQD